MTAIMPLWADGDWVKLIVPLVMFSVWALNRLFGGESPAAKQAKARQQARANPPPPPADKQRVEDEVSEFLRRAAQQRNTAGHTRTPPPKESPRPPAPPRKSLASQARQDDLAAAEGARAAGKPRTLAPTLSGPFDQSPLNERTVQGNEVVQAGAAMQSHLSQVFDHSVGTISGKQTDTAAVPSESPTAPAEQLAGMLRNPQSVRDAIIVSEILRRPEERW